MRPIRLTCAFLALTLLAACDKEAPPRPNAPPAPPPMSTNPAPEPAAPSQAPAPAAPVQPAPEPKPATPPAPRPVSPPPVPVTPNTPAETATAQAPQPEARLDLSLPKDLDDTLEVNAVTDEMPVLPQMFVGKPAPEGPFHFNGKLITNERETDAWHSVEGAELQFEFKR
ncbi:hypothetical protein D9M70_442400 [compost metagenome]